MSEINTVEKKGQPDLPSIDKQEDIVKETEVKTEDRPTGLDLAFSQMSLGKDDKKDKVIPEKSEEEEKGSTDEKQKEPTLDKTSSKPTSLDGLLDRLSPEERALVDGAIDSTEKRRKDSEKEFYKALNKQKELEKELTEAKAATQSQDAAQWLNQFNEKFNEGDMEGVQSVAKDLYSKYENLQKRLSEVSTQMGESAETREKDLVNSQLEVLQMVERRMTDDFDDYYGKADSGLVDYINGSDDLKTAFIQTRDKFGVPKAMYDFQKKRVESMNPKSNDDNYITIEEAKKRFGSGEEEKKPNGKVAAANITSKATIPNAKNIKQLGATSLDRYFAKKSG